MKRFLLRKELEPFFLPASVDKWPLVIQIDDGPFIVSRPKHWNLTHEESQYVYLQGVLESGNHEHIYIPLSHACDVTIYRRDALVSECFRNP